MTEIIEAHTLLQALNQLVDGNPTTDAAIRSELDDLGWTKEGVLIPLPTHLLGQPLERESEGGGRPHWWVSAHPYDFEMQLFFEVVDDWDIHLVLEIYVCGEETLLRIAVGPEDNLVTSLQSHVESRVVLLQRLLGGLQ